ncbi:MAG TPA: zf-HC2 domain-containing protein [Candidatus Eisenbacteria bacterium]|nr:zf-HC2 domain-containing protein [Candidatus Eisenbacteria bacterium]
MIHLTPQQLSSYMDGELNEVSTELVRRHMGVCEECTLKFAALEEQEEQLSHALVHEPGDDFFDGFAAEVERQLPAGKRGSSSPAGRAAAIREAARDAAKEAARNAAREAILARAPAAQDAVTATPFHAPEPEPVRPAAIPRRPEPEPTPTDTGMPMGDESDLDADETLAALSVGRATDEPPPIPRPSPARRPTPDPSPRPRERKAPSPPPRTRAAQRPPQRPKIRRPAPSIPWYAALILAAIAGAASVVVSRMDPVSAWLDAHGLRNLLRNHERPAPAEPGPQTPPPEQAAPAQDVPESRTGKGTQSGVEAGSSEAQPSDNSGSADDDFVEPQPQAADRFLTPRGTETTGSRDPFAGLPPGSLSQVRTAQRSKAAADAQPSADRYDAAADEWERTIPLLRGARQQSLSRLELATSRYRAWESEPTAGRAASAATAIRAYLAFAPQGAPRDLVRSWLARVSH